MVKALDAGYLAFKSILDPSMDSPTLPHIAHITFGLAPSSTFQGLDGDNQRISRSAFIGSIIVILIIAVISAIARTVLRYRLYRTLTSSDYLLIFSCLCLIAAQSFTLALTNSNFGKIPLWGPSSFEPLASRAIKVNNPSAAGQTLTFVALYGVKGGFLTFFHQLLVKSRPWMVYWWSVLVVLVITGIAVVVLGLLLVNQVTFLITITVLDIFTDLLLISIPVRLLWNLQKPLLERLFIGSVLSVSILMVVISVVRAAGAHTSEMPPGFIDPIWLIFWSAIEVDVAVLMLSLTIFTKVFRKRDDSVARMAERDLSPNVATTGTDETQIRSDEECAEREGVGQRQMVQTRREAGGNEVQREAMRGRTARRNEDTLGRAARMYLGVESDFLQSPDLRSPDSVGPHGPKSPDTTVSTRALQSSQGQGNPSSTGFSLAGVEAGTKGVRMSL